jgi:hypothetical protein
MLALFTPALLLASAALAQTQTPSVVTFISISPTPESEQVFSIQTVSVSSTPCYEACIMEPCAPCKHHPVSMPSTHTNRVNKGGVTSVAGSMGIPQGETPIPSSLLSGNGPATLPSTLPAAILPSTLPGAILSSTLPGAISTIPSAWARTGTPTGGAAPSPASSTPAQQSTGVAPSLQGDRTPLKLALAVSGLALMGATLVLL